MPNRTQHHHRQWGQILPLQLQLWGGKEERRSSVAADLNQGHSSSLRLQEIFCESKSSPGHWKPHCECSVNLSLLSASQTQPGCASGSPLGRCIAHATQHSDLTLTLGATTRPLSHEKSWCLLTSQRSSSKKKSSSGETAAGNYDCGIQCDHPQPLKYPLGWVHGWVQSGGSKVVSVYLGLTWRTFPISPGVQDHSPDLCARPDICCVRKFSIN